MYNKYPDNFNNPNGFDNPSGFHNPNGFNNPDNSCHHHHHKIETHDHEIVDSVIIAELREDPHNHRFATISGEAIEKCHSHVHKVTFRTDFYEGHFHEFCGETGLAIDVGGGRHVHFLESVTQISDGHAHKFRFATLINDPIGDK